MSKFANNIFIYISFIFIFSCEPSGKKPSEMSPQELVKSREIRKISDVKILETGKNFGDEIINWINDRMISSSNPDSINFRKILNEVQTDSSILKPSITLKLILIDSGNKIYEPDSIESQILEACIFSLDNGIAISETVQMSDDNKAVRYIEPILVNQKLNGLWSLKIPKKLIVTSID